jgi:dipeptidyl aminopeptidase/acylaminoacyl peptidase
MTPRISTATLLLSLLVVTACVDSDDPIAPDSRMSSSQASPKRGGPKAVPERGVIVFTKAVGFNEEIFTINEDGSGERRLTYGMRFNLMPAVSPDGRRVAYYSGDVTSALDLYVMNIDGSNPRRLAALGLDIGRISDLAWSPDGMQLAAGLALDTDPAEMDIYTIHAKNGALTQLTSEPGEELWPTWSPDGQTLAFNMRNNNGIFNVFMRDSDSQVTQYTFCNVSCRQPRWSPDGNLISWFDASLSATVIAHIGASYAVVGTIPGGRHAAWSPDGARLAFILDAVTLATASASGDDVQQLQTDGALLGVGGWARR